MLELHMIRFWSLLLNYRNIMSKILIVFVLTRKCHHVLQCLILPQWQSETSKKHKKMKGPVPRKMKDHNKNWTNIRVVL